MNSVRVDPEGHRPTVGQIPLPTGKKKVPRLQLNLPDKFY